MNKLQQLMTDEDREYLRERFGEKADKYVMVSYKDFLAAIESGEQNIKPPFKAKSLRLWYQKAIEYERYEVCRMLSDEYKTRKNTKSKIEDYDKAL